MRNLKPVFRSKARFSVLCLVYQEHTDLSLDSPDPRSHLDPHRTSCPGNWLTCPRTACLGCVRSNSLHISANILLKPHWHRELSGLGDCRPILLTGVYIPAPDGWGESWIHNQPGACSQPILRPRESPWFTSHLDTSLGGHRLLGSCSGRAGTNLWFNNSHLPPRSTPIVHYKYVHTYPQIERIIHYACHGPISQTLNYQALASLASLTLFTIFRQLS